MKEIAIESLGTSFQPIVNIHSGLVLGFEAFICDQQKCGHQTVESLIEEFEQSGRCADIELQVIEKSLLTYATFARHREYKLFTNISPLSLVDITGFSEKLRAICMVNDLPPESLLIEFTEKRNSIYERINREKLQMKFKMVLDDFGVGLSGFHALYVAEPSFIKLDRFFIKDLAVNAKKRLYVSTIVSLAHSLSIYVIAECIETAEEYFLCKELGCDYVQGFFMQRPTRNTSDLRVFYEEIAELSGKDRRNRTMTDRKLLEQSIVRVPSLSSTARMIEVFEFFARNKKYTSIPIVNHMNEPVGIVREEDIKEWGYSMYGKELLQNRSIGYSLSHFMSPCKTTDIHFPISKILDIFASTGNPEGILITDNMKYVGVLSSEALLSIIHDKNIQEAVDQNPLTKLPGNSAVHTFVNDVLEDNERICSLVYFDFDNFKAFNDKYGFRAGDRAILLFAEILQKDLVYPQRFIAHIGGDDFFAGLRSIDSDESENLARHLLEQFRLQAESLYSPEDRLQGYVESYDRDGELRRFPLLTVSAAILHLPAPRFNMTFEIFSGTMATLKKKAKRNSNGMAVMAAESHSDLQVSLPLDYVSQQN
jgi:diguanylate cyclase (GGDEF)-like protein